MSEKSIYAFTSPSDNGPVINVERIMGPELTIVNDHRKVKGEICGLVVVTPHGYIAGWANAHDDIVGEIQELTGKTVTKAQARGFLTTEKEFLSRSVAGAWALANKVILPEYEGQTTLLLYSYHINRHFARYPFEE